MFRLIVLAAAAKHSKPNLPIFIKTMDLFLEYYHDSQLKTTKDQGILCNV